MSIKIQIFFSNLQASLLALLKILILSHFKPKVQKKQRLREALILGNGPSLKGMISSFGKELDGKDIICVNHFPSTDEYEKIRPAYFITSATELWMEGIKPSLLNASEKTFNALVSKTSWPLELYIPYEARKYPKWQNILKQNNHIKIIYFNNVGIEGWKWLIHLLFKKNLAMPRPHNVVITSIFLSINLGYKKIYIWGAEHNQFREITVDMKNNVLIHQKHFYDESSSKPQAMLKDGLHPRRLHEILYKFMLSFKGYFILEDYAKECRVKIINQTPDSLIDAFDREELSQDIS